MPQDARVFAKMHSQIRWFHKGLMGHLSSVQPAELQRDAPSNLHWSRRLNMEVTVVLLVVSAAALTSLTAPNTTAQTPEGLSILTYKAFSQVAEIYHTGGNAPDLVAKLNDVLQLIHEAQLKRSKGDVTTALKLEDQARTEDKDIMNEATAAQQIAENDASTKTLLAILGVPLSAGLSTYLFYAALRARRWYDKGRLYEMIIIERPKEKV